MLPYRTSAQSRIVHELEHIQELRDDITLFKEPMSKALEELQALEQKRDTNENPLASCKEPKTTPALPSGFTPMNPHNSNQGAMLSIIMNPL